MRSSATAAVPHKSLLISYELPADFIETLRGDADALESEITRQTQGSGTSVSTNASIEAGLGRVDELVERLEVFVRNKYRGDAARLAAWESARHLERAPRSKRKAEPAPDAQTPK